LGGAAVAAGINLCRDLVNAPPNYNTPQSLADAAEMIARDHGLEVEILDEEQVRV
jgi:leucyl aminopeptidase